MEKSIVNISMKDDNNYELSYAIITKEKNKLKKSVIIILKELECAVFDYDNFKENDDFKFLLLKHYDNTKYALQDFYKIIGKMCHKSIESKYFLNPKDEYNRIKFIDFDRETMNFDYNDRNLFIRYNNFKESIQKFRKLLYLGGN